MTADSCWPIAAISALVLGCVATDKGVVRGSVAYGERAALPPDAVVEIRLSDVSLQDVAAPVIAETTIASAGRQVPISFELRYEPGRIQPNRTYAVRAVIRSAARMLFTTNAAYHVITQGNPSQVDLWLVRVGEPLPNPASNGPAFRIPPSSPGRLALAAGRLRFIPCGQDGEGQPVEDLASNEGKTLLREFGAGENGIAVMVRLDGNQVQQIRYAGPEGPGCDRLPPEGDVEARGNEPFWMVRVDGGEATVRTPQAPEGVRYTDGRWAHLNGAQWRYEAQRALGEGAKPLTLELSEERCIDSMSGARYPFRAILTRDGARMEGCALEGRALRVPAAER